MKFMTMVSSNTLDKQTENRHNLINNEITTETGEARKLTDNVSVEQLNKNGDRRAGEPLND